MMSFKLIDTHCHLDFSPFSESETYYLNKAQESGVTKFIVPSVNQLNWDKVSELAERNEGVYYALGIHPLFISSDYENEIERLKDKFKVQAQARIAIGECGLDFWDPECNRDIQIHVFREQCLLAKTHQLPLIVHSRKSHDHVLKVLREIKPEKGGVIHGFSGSLQQANQFINLGFYIGVGGVISYERAIKTKRTISELSLDRLLLETDAPDMPLSGFQGVPNSPDKVRHILECLILLRKESRETIANAVYRNTNHLFGI